MGSWVFGCDICQQVCPWNRFATSQVDPAFDHHLSQPAPNLLDELALSARDFNHKYRHSPIKRAKRRGYLRNVAVALGNLRKLEAISPLSQALIFDHDPLVRAHDAWALGRIGSTSARQVLESAAGTENDAIVKSEIQTSLAEIGQG